MTRESRYNLIFLAILLAVMVPGAVILFRKKLDPMARPMYLPDPVRRTVAYMSPQETPPGMARVAPPRTTEWVTGMKSDIAGMAVARPRDSEGVPLMSSTRAYEVVTYAKGRDGFRVLVLFWSPPPPSDASWSMEGQTGTVEFSKAFELPYYVRDELGANGMLTPPREVTFQSIRFARPPGDGDFVLALRSGGGREADAAKIVTSFTNPATTRN